MAKEMPNQLKHGISPCNVEIDFRLLMIKPLHAKICTFICTSCTFICRVVHSYAEGSRKIINGFKSAGISEAMQNAGLVLERTENPFHA